VAAWLNPRALKRKADAEADAKAIDALDEIIATQRAQLLDASAREKGLHDDALREARTLADERVKARVACEHLCMHMGCALRLPAQGLGARWVEEHEDMTDVGADYDPVDVLLRRYRRELLERRDAEKVEARA